MDGHDFLDVGDDDDRPIARAWAMPLDALVARRAVLRGLGAGLGLPSTPAT